MSTSTAFRRDRASGARLEAKLGVSSIIQTRNVTTYLKTEVVNDTCNICRKTSKANATIITAEILIPPAATWTTWMHPRRTTLMRDACQGTSLSTRRPTTGPRATPNIPTNPNNPITKLERRYILGTISGPRKNQHTSNSSTADRPEGKSASPRNSQSKHWSQYSQASPGSTEAL